MITTPIDIVKVLTAAAPIVASLASMATNTEKEKEKEKKGKDAEPNISVTINNTFYTNSEKDAEMAASKICNQLIRGVSYSEVSHKS